MMMLSVAAIPPNSTLSKPNTPYQTNCNLLFIHPTPHNPTLTPCRATAVNAASSSSTPLRYTSHGQSSSDHRKINESDDGRGGEREDYQEEDMVPSASAVAAIIRKVSTSPVEFVQRIEKAGSKNRGGAGGGGGLVLPSVDFQRLCLEQLDLFRRIVHPDALLSVYVRPAGSYVMDRLELRRITFYPVVNEADIVILVGNFGIAAGLRSAEAAVSSQAAEFFPELRSVVFPMVKHPFVVGFLVAEFPQMILGEEARPSPGESCFLPNITDSKLMELQMFKGKSAEIFGFTTEQILNAENISRSLAMAHVLDQKAILLQQSSWQNNVRMSSLVEQIRGSLSGIRTLSKMLSVHMRRSEISFDIVEDILMLGDHMRDILQQLQDAVYLTKANIIHNNGGELKTMHEPPHGHPNSINETQESYEAFSLNPTANDSEIPMPPLALAPLKQKAVRKPCNVSDVLNELVGAVEPLARKQQRFLKVSEISQPLQVAVEEPALRQALSNLIEGSMLRTQVGGKVEIVSTGAPAGGALVIIDDDGPDMHYMTQVHSLTPFGMDLFTEDKVEDNMTWNFIAGLAVAREILESYGCVVRVISPRTSDVGIGAGGTRIEMWLPYATPGTDEIDQV